MGIDLEQEMCFLDIETFWNILYTILYNVYEQINLALYLNSHISSPFNFLNFSIQAYKWKTPLGKSAHFTWMFTNKATLVGERIGNNYANNNALVCDYFPPRGLSILFSVPMHWLGDKLQLKQKRINACLRNALFNI